jgi:CDP-diacylglycerol--glycerol-3-phosphate 3-phosphatidyltransferase
MSGSEETNGKTPWSFEQFLRKTFKGVLDTIAGFLLKIGLTPNAVTLMGVVLSFGVAVLIGMGYLPWAGLLMILSAPMDALDGSMARLKGPGTKFGAFLDSVTDRYSELIILGGLLYYFLNLNNVLACMLVFISAAGSVLVSYTKARGESLGYSVNVGLLARVERVIILDICLLFNIPMIALWALAVLANFTALQRIFHVRKQANPS